MADEQDTKPKSRPMITVNRMAEADLHRHVWIANIEFGRTINEILDPSYWALMAYRMTIYDQIEARAEDGAWIAYLIVTGVDRTWARVAVDRVLTLTTSDVAATQAAMQKHKVEWKGPQYKYAVIRLSDDAKVKDGFQNKEDAGAWMREHERTVGVPTPG